MVFALLAGPGRGELTDPTRPATLPAGSGVFREAPQALRLHSVLLSPGRRVAVISGQRVQIGDRVLATRVVEISLSGVRLRGPDGDVLLTLTGTRFKTPSARQNSR